MSIEYLEVNDPRVFVFDLEFLGDVKFPHETRIYSIAVVHSASGRHFSKIIDPQVSATQLQRFHTYPGCRQVTRKWLRKQKAAPLAAAFHEMQQFVQQVLFKPGLYLQLPKQSPIFIAHACFLQTIIGASRVTLR